MSYTLTLDVPQEAVRFAEDQANLRGVDFSALFVAFLRDRFGYDGKVSVAPSLGLEGGTLTQELSGIVKLPQDVSDKDLIASAMVDKYNSL